MKSRTAEIPLVTLYVLFVPVRLFCVGCFCSYYVVAASDWSLDLFVGAAGRVVSVALWQKKVDAASFLIL